MVPKALITAATAIGFVVMFSWFVLIVWLSSRAIGAALRNHCRRRYEARELDNLRSSWLLEMKDQYPLNDGRDYDTVELVPLHLVHPYEVHYKIHEMPTEETGAVYDIRERYPHESA